MSSGMEEAIQKWATSARDYRRAQQRRSEARRSARSEAAAGYANETSVALPAHLPPPATGEPDESYITKSVDDAVARAMQSEPMRAALRSIRSDTGHTTPASNSPYATDAAPQRRHSNPSTRTNVRSEKRASTGAPPMPFTAADIQYAQARRTTEGGASAAPTASGPGTGASSHASLRDPVSPQQQQEESAYASTRTQQEQQQQPADAVATVRREAAAPPPRPRSQARAQTPQSSGGDIPELTSVGVVREAGSPRSRGTAYVPQQAAPPSATASPARSGGGGGEGEELDESAMLPVVRYPDADLLPESLGPATPRGPFAPPSATDLAPAPAGAPASASASADNPLFQQAQQQRVQQRAAVAASSGSAALAGGTGSSGLARPAAPGTPSTGTPRQRAAAGNSANTGTARTAPQQAPSRGAAPSASAGTPPYNSPTRSPTARAAAAAGGGGLQAHLNRNVRGGITAPVPAAALHQSSQQQQGQQQRDSGMPGPYTAVMTPQEAALRTTIQNAVKQAVDVAVRTERERGTALVNDASGALAKQHRTYITIAHATVALFAASSFAASLILVIKLRDASDSALNQIGLRDAPRGTLRELLGANLFFAALALLATIAVIILQGARPDSAWSRDNVEWRANARRKLGLRNESNIGWVCKTLNALALVCAFAVAITATAVAALYSAPASIS